MDEPANTVQAQKLCSLNTRGGECYAEIDGRLWKLLAVVQNIRDSFEQNDLGRNALIEDRDLQDHGVERRKDSVYVVLYQDSVTLHFTWESPMWITHGEHSYTVHHEDLVARVNR